MLAAIYNKLAGEAGYPPVSAPPCVNSVDELLADLLQHKGKSIVVSGSNDPAIQQMVAGINYMLDNYGSTLDLERTLQVKQGDDKKFAVLSS